MRCCMKVKIPKKETNNFEYTIFGIDLFLKYLFTRKKQKKSKKSSKYKHNML